MTVNGYSRELYEHHATQLSHQEQEMYPRDAVICHDDIIAELKRQDAETFSLHSSK